jgi:preprotein translocase subunit SecF
MKGIQFVPNGTNLNFIGLRHFAFVLSAVLLIGSIGLAATKGLNFGIDFTGGTVIEIKTPDTPNLSDMRSTMNGFGLGGIIIQEFGAPDDLLIRLPQQEGGPEAEAVAMQSIRDVLSGMYPDGGVDYRRTEFVGPQVGDELKKQGLYAILFALAGILAYVWFRFEWQFGVASVIALAHDSIATIGFFALMQMEFNLSTVAAILMIAGYSINDTVVVFDRIREKLRKYKKKPLHDVFNLALNKTLARTLMTSVTTLLALVALYVWGGEVIQGFVVALIFGIVIGTYSSIFIAAPLLLSMNVKRSTFDEDQPEEAA